MWVLGYSYIVKMISKIDFMSMLLFDKIGLKKSILYSNTSSSQRNLFIKFVQATSDSIYIFYWSGTRDPRLSLLFVDHGAEMKCMLQSLKPICIPVFLRSHADTWSSTNIWLALVYLGTFINYGLGDQQLTFIVRCVKTNSYPSSKSSQRVKKKKMFSPL